MDNPKTCERECASLLQIKDANPKMIIARTHHNMAQYKGIKIMDIANWLISK